MTLAKTTKAHGLDGTLVAPDWPPLTRDEIGRILANYGRLGGPFEILSVSPRPLSAAGIVGTRNEKVFVKRHARSVRDAQDLREEHRFMQHLRDRGAPIPRLLLTDSGESVLEVGDWTYEVFEPASGIDLYGDAISWTPSFSADHARSTGEMMARLHVAAQGYNAPARSRRQLVAGFTIYSRTDPESEMKQYIAARPQLRKYLEQRDCMQESITLLAPFHQELIEYLHHLAPLWTHNDLHPSNLFWSTSEADATATSVIDFGLCDRTNAVHDLAHAIERSIVEWLFLINNPTRPEQVPVHLDHLWALLEGYESVRPLSHPDAMALAPMTALCHAEFALSETDYFLAVLHSEEKAYFACEGYLILHSKWWRGPGALILDSLRAWAQKRPTGDRGKAR